jgi:nucleotide-binding universal stress UspA family protein
MTNTNSPIFKKFTNILVGIDGSKHSFQAAEYALELAKQFEAKVYAVTVTYIPPSNNLSHKQVLSNSLIEDAAGNKKIKDSELWFDNFVQNASVDKVDLKTELLNSTRPVDYVLLEFAEENDIDLIVLGTKGRTGFKKLLLGSVASSVVTMAHCPVLVVK